MMSMAESDRGPQNGDLDKMMNIMEKSMDDEAEKLRKNADPNKLKHSQTREAGGSVKASNTHGYDGGDRVDSNGNLSRMSYLHIEHVTGRDTALDSEDEDDMYMNSSSEALEEELRRPMYVLDSQTGCKTMKIQFPVHGFESEDIRVKYSNSKLVIFAVNKKNESGRKSTTEFCRKLKLPEDVSADKLQCTFIDGVLTLQAPVKQKEQPKVTVLVEKDEPLLNTPVIEDSELGRRIRVRVEVGRLFKANDVVVKLKGAQRLVVIGERHETEDKTCTLSASLRREYELPHAINPASLKAGLTHDGILNVTVLIQDN